jgi:hypothetical protein
MKCKQCNKPIKENTDGNMRYCQGHEHQFYSFITNKYQNKKVINKTTCKQ